MNKIAGLRLIEKVAKKFEDMTPRNQNWVKDQTAYGRAIMDAPSDQLLEENKEVGKKTLKGMGLGLLAGIGAGATMGAAGVAGVKSIGKGQLGKAMKLLKKTTRAGSKARQKGNYDLKIKYVKNFHRSPAVGGLVGGFYGGIAGALGIGGKAEIAAIKDIEKSRGMTVERKFFKRPKVTFTPAAEKKYRNK